MYDPSQILPVIRYEIGLVALDQRFRCNRLKKSNQRVIGEAHFELLRFEGFSEDRFSDRRLPLQKLAHPDYATARWKSMNENAPGRRSMQLLIPLGEGRLHFLSFEQSTSAPAPFLLRTAWNG